MQFALVLPFLRIRPRAFRFFHGGILALVLLLSAHARAEIVYATGFEAPVFTAGLPVAGQDGWTSRFGSPAGTVSTNTPASGLQAVEMRAEQMLPCCFGFNVEAVRKFVNFDVAAAGARGVFVSADVRLNGPRLQDDLVEAIFSATDPGFNDYGQMQISADGHLYIYGSQFSDAFVGDVTLGEYHNLAMAIDFSNRETSFFLDGAFQVTFAFDPSELSTVLWGAPFLMAAPSDLENPSDYVAYFDNLLIEAVPEPATLALFGTGILCLASVRRRRAA